MQSRRNFQSGTLLVLLQLILGLVTPSHELHFLELQNGPHVDVSWYIAPGKPCNPMKEMVASRAYRALSKKANSNDVKRIIGDICYGGKEVELNPLRCVKDICDCHSEDYTWDASPNVVSCRARLGHRCHSTGALPCVTNTTCHLFACKCDEQKFKTCTSDKIPANAIRMGGIWLVLWSNLALALIGTN